MIDDSKSAGEINIAGLKTVLSDFDANETIKRLEAEILALGMNVFARINHAALASEVGLTLRPTEVIIFGNPRGGTPLMQASQTIGIDLPLKALVWQDASGKTWLAYNNPACLAARHKLNEIDGSVSMMEQVLAAVAQKATRLTSQTS